MQVQGVCIPYQICDKSFISGILQIPSCTSWQNRKGICIEFLAHQLTFFTASSVTRLLTYSKVVACVKCSFVKALHVFHLGVGRVLVVSWYFCRAFLNSFGRQSMKFWTMLHIISFASKLKQEIYVWRTVSKADCIYFRGTQRLAENELKSNRCCNKLFLFF